MDSNDLFAQSEADVHTEDLSSIIPSSELDPPPPVTYVVPPCKPGDLCIADTETLDTHEASDSIDDGLDAEAMKKHRHMFSQADDFQDSSERCGRFLGDIEHSDNSPNTTEEGTWSRNVLTETPFPIVKLNPVDSASCVEQQQSSVLSPSELPHMTPAEKVNMIGPQVRVSSSVVRHRESTPVHLDRVPVNLRQPTLDAGNQSFSPSFSVPKRALTRASEPAPTTVKSLGVGDSPSAEGPNDSWPKSNQDSDSVRNSSPAAAENSWNSNANSCDTKNIVEDTESERSGTRNSPNEPTQELSVHLSVLSSSAGSNARANPKAVFMSGFTVEVASLYASATVDLLQNRCIALVHQLIGYICGARSDVSTPYNSSQHSACEPSSSTSGPSLNSKLNEHLTAPSKMTAKPMVAKPLFQANFRGSSSSNSDLFSPRPKKAYTATNAVESSGIGSLTSLSGSLLRTLPNAKCLPPPAVRSSSSSSGTFYPRGQKLLGITRSSTSSSDPSTSPKSSAATHGLQPLTDQDSTVRPTGASAKAADNNELPSSEMEVPRQFTNVPDSCAESQKAITFQPSLALVLETPLEYNEENRSKCLPHPDSSSTVTPVDLKVTKCSPAEVRTKSPNTIELDSNGRLLVYGRWHTEQYYYAGAMSVTKPNFRRLVQFEDGSRARLKPSDILAVHLLPVNTEVFVDWDDTSEYTGDCIVEGHLTDPKLPYLILSRVTKERKALSRRQVSVHHSQVCHLRRMGQLSSETLDVILKRITQSERDSKCLPAVDEDRPLLLASPDISLANVLFGKRQAKTKRFRSSWVTPTNRAMSDDEDSQTHESGASRVRHQSVPQTHPKCETPPKRVLDKSDEDICPKKQCLEESNGGDISPDQVTSKSVDEKSDDLTKIDLRRAVKVFVDWDDTSEYTGDCIVEGHLTDPKLPYLILSRVTKERKALSRRQVSVHHSQVCHLRRMGQLSSETLDVILKRITQSERDSKCLPAVDEDRPLLLASPDISLANVLFGKRQAKTKRFRSSWVTPTNRAMSDDEDSQTHESGASRVRHQSVPQTHPKCETPPKRVLDKSDEDICPKKQCLEESNGGDISPDQVTSKSVDEKSDDLTTPRRSKSTSRPSSARGSLFPASPTSLSFLISICRSLSVPTPSTTLFSGWTIILTGGPRSLADASGSSSRPMNRGHFEQLILLCGGRVGSEITPAIIGRPQPSGSPVMGEDQNPDEDTNHSEQHIALVAPDVCRTLKYFQALATLGQVPLLSTDWILDSCREEASSVVDENHEPGTDQHANWPLQLLLNYPGRYELPRGLVTETRKLISWCAVPVRYRSPAYRSLPALSLFDLQANWLDDKQHKFQLIAIVTDDQNVFAPAWSNILQLAGGASVHFDSERVGSQTATQTILVLSTKEAPRHLNNLAKSKTYWSKHETSFVLVDKSGLRHRTLTSLKNSPFQLVTCDYFIQSLICGHLLNPNSSSAFIPA